MNQLQYDLFPFEIYPLLEKNNSHIWWPLWATLWSYFSINGYDFTMGEIAYISSKELKIKI